MGETVKFLYSHDGFEYPWEHPSRPTYAADYDVNALLLPFEFVHGKEPDLPNTLGKISVVVGEREYPIMVNFWDALRRFNETNRNIRLFITQCVAGFGVFYAILWVAAQVARHTITH